MSQMTDAQRAEYVAQQRALAEANGGFYRDEFFVTSVPTDPAVAPITLNDIASFRPVTGSAGMEPNGWMVTGLDTNFYSAAASHIVGGELLGAPAEVRFTPRAWLWTYGDGSFRRTSYPGASWAALGVAEFEPTATSHVYSSPGTFTIDLAIEFSAEYRVGAQGWTPIAGTLNVPAARFTAAAGAARTVLVARDCLANPRGPGC
jgi:PKD repeat protein